ncbi:Solitary outer membrane autotransporter beta-barrel domain [Marinimicrobium sp. ABcell2]|uniref:Solitary outer membrane autotransporter beta-barrel domain n=1 Tax=Marinimicrobium sp. ABcell2 TaxID=3069751 RepID=UPI0027AF7D80|nr:Solitary outer membrane autotransporter beta-barrel domain [Marinimicrobium sp. ABcell2]MDQ2075141.1 Solitary outer membrane autotransporter beta-barrel domain [Marinimicrobium sp. ABcell2]
MSLEVVGLVTLICMFYALMKPIDRSAGTRGHWARGLIALVFSLWYAAGSAQTADEANAAFAERQAESAFATSVVLTDAEVLTVGILSFDPDSFIPMGNDQFGTEESVGRRDSVTTFTFPWKWTLGPDENRLTPYINGRLSYLETTQDIFRGSPDEPENGAREESKGRVYGGRVGVGVLYELTQQWELDAGAGLHLLRYQNDYTADLTLSPDAGEGVEDLLFDTAATALMADVQTRATYSSEVRGVPWEYQSTLSYYAGDTVSSDQGLDDVSPETWSWAKGVTAYWELPEVLGTSNKLRLLARRVDVGGDVTLTLETDHYYQMGVSWLFDIDGPSWLDNLGAGIMVNYGSALSGGSFMILYNEDW